MKALPLCLILGTLALPLASQAAPADLVKAAQAEGTVNSIGMPDSWANWKETWQDLHSQFGLAHMDTDMSSAEEIAKFAPEAHDATSPTSPPTGMPSRPGPRIRRVTGCWPIPAPSPS